MEHRADSIDNYRHTSLRTHYLITSTHLHHPRKWLPLPNTPCQRTPPPQICSLVTKKTQQCGSQSSSECYHSPGQTQRKHPTLPTTSFPIAMHQTGSMPSPQLKHPPSPRSEPPSMPDGCHQNDPSSHERNRWNGSGSWS